MFSILIPTWNNLDYLQLAISSIRQHSAHDHEILVHVNEGLDGTLQWLQEQGIRHTHSERNLGVCMAVNQLAGIASRDWIVFLNDDMVCCRGWDLALVDAIEKASTDLMFLSSRLIEPTDTGNQLVLIHDCGRSPAAFDEQKLQRFCNAVAAGDTVGAAAQPTVVARRWWQMVGGYSLEFSPGMASDIDLLIKLWIVGCREFRIVDASRIYHFSCRSTGRIRKNKGDRTFVMKWGITESEFRRHYLSRPTSGANDGGNPIGAFPRATPLGRLKRVVYGLTGNFPLEDFEAWDAAPARSR